MRTSTGAEILEVFWLDEDRQTVGCLVRNRTNTWASEYSMSEIRTDGDPTELLRAAAHTVISGGRVEQAA